MGMVRIDLLPEGTSIEADSETPLIDLLKENGILLNLPCGGEGRCGKCIVKVAPKGAPSSAGLPYAMVPGDDERRFLSDKSLESGLRLACRVIVTADIEVTIPPSSRLAGAGRAWEGMDVAGLGEEQRAGGLFLAVDVGTTSIAAAVVGGRDAATGATGGIIAHASALNPQTTFGADVISRINAVSKDEKALEHQKQLVLDAVNGLIDKLTANLSVEPIEIKGAAFAGNPTMEHLLLGINPIPIAHAPFTPAFTKAVRKSAKVLGLNIDPDGEAYVFPVISGYVGGDTLAFVWSSRIHESKDIILGIDIGTNGEIVLGNKDRLLSCSAAAGPAFEGSQIRDGMRADFGAIEGVVIKGDKVMLKVKGDNGGGAHKTPTGICGSGIFDAVDQLIKAKVVGESGRIQKGIASKRLSERIKKSGSVTEFVLHEDIGKNGRSIGITQKDIREVQLAKGAIRSGAEILLAEMGIGWGEIKTVLIAGAFGNFLKPESIVGVGLLPKVIRDRIRFVGDAALTGAVEAVVDTAAREGIEKLAESIDYIELSSDKRFNDIFIERLSFSD
ncbi:MAG: DUF4445 domain-containing protein [Deltaproteobacteria bacterium]|uniref:DUF4445 domain-containing protein n=1 Tax=Candidatus Zymogenus saltonus TaxID=2844893 RepID=A0A9D8KBM6_9DELT|nr:DUF4445 domain-containing protein [Candidatus Zymogenus saltonus]